MDQNFQGKKVMIVGAQKTGVALARFFKKKGAAEITVSDLRPREKLGDSADLLDEMSVTWDLGGHSSKVMVAQDLIVFSPGVDPHSRVFEPARARGIPMMGELELASSFVREPIVAVTGTNGKSSVVDFATEILKASGVNAWLGGNFGRPLIDYVTDEEKADVVVLEVSSFQLDTVDNFKPHHSCLLNVAEDHLDRYKDMNNYVASKKRMFKNLNPECVAILNADDQICMEVARDPIVQRGQLFYFSKKSALEEQVHRIGGCVSSNREVRYYKNGNVERYNLRNLKMKGKHAVDNVMAAILLTRSYGAKPEAIQQVIDNYQGLEHRLEFVRNRGGVDFYNDSKSTNVHSVMRALEAFDDPVILIAGGKDKGVAFEPLVDLVHQKVKNLILIGEAKERLNRAIGDYSETFIIGTFEEAVYLAFQKSRSGDVILLSPGCSSQDMFENFEERGKYYKELVQRF